MDRGLSGPGMDHHHEAPAIGLLLDRSKDRRRQDPPQLLQLHLVGERVVLQRLALESQELGRPGFGAGWLCEQIGELLQGGAIEAFLVNQLLLPAGLRGGLLGETFQGPFAFRRSHRLSDRVNFLFAGCANSDLGSGHHQLGWRINGSAFLIGEGNLESNRRVRRQFSSLGISAVTATQILRQVVQGKRTLGAIRSRHLVGHEELEAFWGKFNLKADLFKLVPSSLEGVLKELQSSFKRGPFFLKFQQLPKTFGQAKIDQLGREDTVLFPNGADPHQGDERLGLIPAKRPALLSKEVAAKPLENFVSQWALVAKGIRGEVEDSVGIRVGKNLKLRSDFESHLDHQLVNLCSGLIKLSIGDPVDNLLDRLRVLAQDRLDDLSQLFPKTLMLKKLFGYSLEMDFIHLHHKAKLCLRLAFLIHPDPDFKGNRRVGFNAAVGLLQTLLGQGGQLVGEELHLEAALGGKADQFTLLVVGRLDLDLALNHLQGHQGLEDLFDIGDRFDLPFL